MWLRRQSEVVGFERGSAPKDLSGFRPLARWAWVGALLWVVAFAAGASKIGYLLFVGDMFLMSYLFGMVSSFVPSNRGKITFRAGAESFLLPGRRFRLGVVMLPALWPCLGLVALALHLWTGVTIFSGSSAIFWVLPEVLLPAVGMYHLFLAWRWLGRWRLGTSLELSPEGIIGTSGGKKGMWRWEDIKSPSWVGEEWKRLLTMPDNTSFQWSELRSDHELAAELIEFYHLNFELRIELQNRGVADRIKDDAFKIQKIRPIS